MLQGTPSVEATPIASCACSVSEVRGLCQELLSIGQMEEDAGAAFREAYTEGGVGCYPPAVGITGRTAKTPERTAKTYSDMADDEPNPS